MGGSAGQGLDPGHLAIEDSPIFTEGQASGAVVAMLSFDDFKDQNWIQVDSPRGRAISSRSRPPSPC